MNKISFWFKGLKAALLTAIGVSAIYSTLDYFYLQNAIETGADPLETGSWDPFLTNLYLIFNLLSIGATIYLLVYSIGFVFRTAQLVRAADPSAISWKPGWVIAGNFIPYLSLIVPFRFLLEINKATSNSDEEKKRTKTLLFANFFLSVAALLIAGNNFTDIILGTVITFEEFVQNEFRVIIGSVFDIAAMFVMFKLIPSIFKGLPRSTPPTE
ncbi:MAG: hypothetical protein RIS31_587 [Actinomycetota bacterium]|jgi:hypothetical protein